MPLPLAIPALAAVASYLGIADKIPFLDKIPGAGIGRKRAIPGAAGAVVGGLVGAKFGGLKGAAIGAVAGAGLGGASPELFGGMQGLLGRIPGSKTQKIIAGSLVGTGAAVAGGAYLAKRMRGGGSSSQRDVNAMAGAWPQGLSPTKANVKAVFGRRITNDEYETLFGVRPRARKLTSSRGRKGSKKGSSMSTQLARLENRILKTIAGAHHG